jgi:hypothetical protein
MAFVHFVDFKSLCACKIKPIYNCECKYRQFYLGQQIFCAKYDV